MCIRDRLIDECGQSVWHTHFVTVRCEPCNLLCDFDIVLLPGICFSPEDGSNTIKKKGQCYVCFAIDGINVLDPLITWEISTDINPNFVTLPNQGSVIALNVANFPGANEFTLRVTLDLEPECVQEVTFFDICGRPNLRSKPENIQSSKSTSPVFNIQPNPFTEYLELEFLGTNDDPIELSLFDTKGHLILNSFNPNISNSKLILETHDLPSGVYFFNLTSGEFSQTRKLIKVE